MITSNLNLVEPSLSEKKSYQELLNGILAFRYVLAS